MFKIGTEAGSSPALGLEEKIQARPTQSSPVNPSPLSARSPSAASSSAGLAPRAELDREELAGRFNLILKQRDGLVSGVFKRTPVPSNPPPPEEGFMNLRRAPVYYASMMTSTWDTISFRGHATVVVGDPGKGARSGLSYYTIGSDKARGGVDVDIKLVDAVKAAKHPDGSPKFPAEAQNAVNRLQGQSFLTKEDFYKKYESVRREAEPNISDKQIFAEAKGVFILGPWEKMEMWLREPNGRKAPSGEDNDKPNMAEQDTRNLENMHGVDLYTGKEFSEMSREEKQSGNTIYISHPEVSLKHQMTADPLKLIEAKQHASLHRLYADETLGRNGTMIPPPVEEQRTTPITDTHKQRTVANVPTYKMFPPHPEGSGNCNSGTATILRMAGVAEQDIKPASEFAFGVRQRLSVWDPLQGQDISHAVNGSPPDGNVDTTPIRGRPIRTAELNAILSEWKMKSVEEVEAEAAAEAAAVEE